MRRDGIGGLGCRRGFLETRRGFCMYYTGKEVIIEVGGEGVEIEGDSIITLYSRITFRIIHHDHSFQNHIRSSLPLPRILSIMP